MADEGLSWCYIKNYGQKFIKMIARRIASWHDGWKHTVQTFLKMEHLILWQGKCLICDQNCVEKQSEITAIKPEPLLLSVENKQPKIYALSKSVCYKTPTSKIFISKLGWNRLYSFISFNRFVPCLTTDPLPLPQQFSYRVCSITSFFNFQHPRFSFRSSISCLHLIPRLSVTFILPFTFPSITCFRRKFLRQDVTNPANLTLCN
jgi:hypothetical protein